MTGNTARPDEAEHLHPQIPEALARRRTDGFFSAWRNLIKEVAVVVVGILLALWADQTMDGINTRQQVSASVDMARRNARTLVYAAAMRDALSPCLGRRLARFP